MKIACMMLGFNPEPLILKSLEAFAKEQCEHDRYYYSFSFPGNNLANIEHRASRLGWKILRYHNLGTAENWNRAWHRAYCPDVLIGVEPDEIPVMVGWTKEIIKPFAADDMAIVSTLQKGLHKKLYLDNYKGTFDTIGGARTIEWEIPTGWPVIAAHKRYLQFGMISNPNYGLFEQMNLEKARSLNMRCLHLLDVESDHLTTDASYERWKVLSGDGVTTKSYEEWRNNEKDV